ncbi:MAG: helix-turn-helix domain-containing protein [Bacteroidales bacterium]|nr:helix-turn-helix domain-containing protein [Bacteroidales bacterium]
MNSFQKTRCFECKEKSLCFKQLNEAELSLTNENRVQLNFKKGEIISKQGSFVTHVMYLKSGFAKVYKETDLEHNLILDIIPEGKLIGLTSLFNNNNNIARFSVAALENAVVCSIDRTTIEKLIHKNSQFAKTVIASLNEESLQFYDKMASLAQKQMNGRVADALLYLSDNIFKSEKFKMILSRKDLADFTGMSMMSVVRTLKDLKTDGIIEDEKGHINIKDINILRQISLNG